MGPEGWIQVTLDALMNAIRDNLKRGVRGDHGVSVPEPSPGAERTEADLDALLTASDLGGVNLATGGRRLGPAILMARRLLLRVLGPVLARQNAYNAINARIVARLRADLERLEARVDELAGRDR